MRLLRNITGQNSNSEVPSPPTDVGESVGWEKATGCEDDFGTAIDDKNLIDFVNKNVPLLLIFEKYNITFESKYSPTGWTQICRCPFKDHNDKFPSFGYNPQEGCFYCFGCQRGGKAVQLISFMENISAISVAKTLAKELKLSNDIADDNNKFDYKRLEKLLFRYSDFILNFKKANNFSKIAIEYAENVTWNLDVYLRKHVVGDDIVLDDLEQRIEKLKEQINLFGE